MHPDYFSFSTEEKAEDDDETDVKRVRPSLLLDLSIQASLTSLTQRLRGNEKGNEAIERGSSYKVKMRHYEKKNKKKNKKKQRKNEKKTREKFHD